MEQTADAPRDLSAPELRVLGCLIEKEATVPDSYPLTVNSLRNACNQSTSRDPVMSLTDQDIERALAALRDVACSDAGGAAPTFVLMVRGSPPEPLESAKLVPPNVQLLWAQRQPRGVTPASDLNADQYRWLLDASARLLGYTPLAPRLATSLDGSHYP